MISYDTIISSDLQNAARHQEIAAQSLGPDSHMAAEMGKTIKIIFNKLEACLYTTLSYRQK